MDTQTIRLNRDNAHGLLDAIHLGLGGKTEGPMDHLVTAAYFRLDKKIGRRPRPEFDLPLADVEPLLPAARRGYAGLVAASKRNRREFIWRNLYAHYDMLRMWGGLANAELAVHDARR